MSVLLNEVINALRHDPNTYEKLAGTNGEDADIINLDGGADSGDKDSKDLLNQLKQASLEIDELKTAIASDKVVDGAAKADNNVDNGDGGAQEKKAELNNDVEANVKEYLMNGVIKEAANEGVLEASRATFEKEVPIYSQYIKNAVWRVKTSALSAPMKKLIFYGLAGIGGGTLGAGAVALKNRSDMNKYRKQVAEAFMADEANDQRKMYDIARRAYQMGLMRAGKEGK